MLLSSCPGSLGASSVPARQPAATLQPHPSLAPSALGATSWSAVMPGSPQACPGVPPHPDPVGCAGRSSWLLPSSPTLPGGVEGPSQDALPGPCRLPAAVAECPHLGVEAAAGPAPALMDRSSHLELGRLLPGHCFVRRMSTGHWCHFAGSRAIWSAGAAFLETGCWNSAQCPMGQALWRSLPSSNWLLVDEAAPSWADAPVDTA